jgi:hypothetical protein
VSRAFSAHAPAETAQPRADIEKLLHSADTAFYQASNAGRKPRGGPEREFASSATLFY